MTILPSFIRPSELLLPHQFKVKVSPIAVSCSSFAFRSSRFRNALFRAATPAVAGQFGFAPQSAGERFLRIGLYDGSGGHCRSSVLCALVDVAGRRVTVGAGGT